MARCAAGFGCRINGLHCCSNLVLIDRPLLQAQPGYLSLVRSLIDGQANAASAMAKLPRAAIDAGLRACLGTDPSMPDCRPHELKSAAILHATHSIFW